MLCQRMGKSIVIFSVLVLIYGKTTRLASLDNAVQTLTNHFCPRIEPLTCDGNTKGVEFSACCSGCSCAEDCTLYDNCCFNNRTTGEVNRESIITCLFTNTKQVPVSSDVKHRFVVKPPPDGCMATGSCQLPEKQIPWTTFDPVYSDKTKKNYVTEECAKCHGINDGLHWNSTISMNSVISYNIEDMLGILMSGDSNRIYVDFFHPIEGTDGYHELCPYFETDECKTADIEQKRGFLRGMNKLFPGITMDHEEFKKLCEHGPKTNFMFDTVNYKNIFCAFCSYILPRSDCTYTYIKTDDSSFVEMLDFDISTNFIYTDFSSKDSSIPMACKSTNRSDCRSVFCPNLRVRTQDGDCRFAARRWRVNGLQILLRLTAPHSDTIDIVQAFPNSTDSDIKQLFYHHTPWDKDWHIINLGMRSPGFNENGTIEFMLHLANVVKDIDPEVVMKSIKASLHKIWIVETPIGGLRLKQDFLEYGGHVIVNYEETRIWPVKVDFGPLDWLEDADEQIKRSVENFTVFRPIWEVLVYTGIERSRKTSNLIINKMFFCHQIELDVDEYEILFDNAVIWLKSMTRLVFSGEFTTKWKMVESKEKVKICVEDSDLSINLASKSFCKRNLLYLITISIINISSLFFI